MAVTALLAGTTSQAAAAGQEKVTRTVLRDGAADVWRVDVRTSEWTLVGALPAADVRRAVVAHRARSVVIRTRFENLRRIGVQTYWTGFTTPEGDFFTRVTSRPGNRAGRHQLTDGSSGARIACARLSHRIDYAADTVTVRVPRHCLDGPRWVKANIGNILVLGDRPHRRHFADNPHDDQPYSNVGTRRIYRG